MWQILIAVAIAGSTSLAAKRFFFNPFSPLPPDSDNREEVQEPLTPPFRIGFLDSRYDNSDGVFRFSSSGSAREAVSGSESNSASRKISRVKSIVRVRGSKKKKKNMGLRGEKGSGSDVCSNRRGFVCLKKLRTSKKNDGAPSRRGLCPYDQDSSVFSSALGRCILYMMSAGKSEINRLNIAMEENVKVVQELKVELSRRKSSRNLQAIGSANGVNTNPMKSSGKSVQVNLNISEMTGRGSHETKLISIPLSDDAEYASSVLTEEPEPEMVEMDRLEMELESELQKLNFAEPDELVEGYNGLDDGSESYQCGGVSPLELNKKLSHLLIEQQEGQIKELEAELQTAQSKLQEKEAELQALKDCVRRLTDFSMSTPSDDEPDQEHRDLFSSRNHQNRTDHERRMPIIIGMKRPLGSSSING